MPFERPSLTDLVNQVAADITAELPGTDALLRHSNLNITGRAQAGMAHGHYGYLDWIARMAVPYTAEGEFLEGWAALKGVYRKPASAASGSAAFAGVNGTVIPANSLVVRGDGVTYRTAADVTISGGTGTVALTAEAAGAAGNATVGTALTLGVTIFGLNSTGAASTAIAGGADVEADADLRNRMLARYAAPPQGGAESDYLAWALDVPGVTRAWVKRNGAGVGTVVVYTMRDIANSGGGGFPSGADGVATDEVRATAATGEQLAVANAIYPLQPVTALVFSVAPQADTKNFTITGLSTASTAIKTAVADAIKGVFLTYGEATGGTVELSYIEAAIAAIAGTTGFVITTPSANITTAVGYLPVLGAITWA